MSGDRLSAIARRFMRHETYTLILSPAVADLQRARVAGASARTMWWLWVGVARAAIGALRVDLGRDLQGGTRGAIDSADRWFAFSAVGVTAVVLLSYYPMLREASAATQLALTLLLVPSAAAAGIVFALVPLGRALARRSGGGWREIAAAGAVFTVVIFLFMDQGVWRANAAYRAVAINELADGTTTLEDQMRFERTATGGARRRMLPFAASAGALLMLGVALRRRHPALTSIATGACLVLYLLLQSQRLASLPREWLPAIVLYVIALAALALSTPAATSRTRVA